LWSPGECETETPRSVVELQFLFQVSSSSRSGSHVGDRRPFGGVYQPERFEVWNTRNNGFNVSHLFLLANYVIF